MKTLIKLAAVLALLIVVAMIAAPYFISADAVKKTLIEKLEAATGHKITLGGELRISFFPSAGVSMEQVTVGEGARQLASVKALTVRVATLPLLSGAVVVESLVLDAPSITLRVDASGRKNWEFASQSGLAAQAGEESGKPSVVPLHDITLSDVRISKGAVSYDDRGAGKTWQVSDLDLAVSLPGMDSPLDVKGQAVWNQRVVRFDSRVSTLAALLRQEKSDVRASVHTDGASVEFSGVVEKEQFRGPLRADVSSIPALQTWLSGKKSGLPATIGLKINTDAACSKTQCHFAKLDSTVGTLKTRGDLTIGFAAAVPQITAKLATDLLDLNQFSAPPKQAQIHWISEAYAAPSGWSRDPIDFSALRAFEGAFDIEAGEVRVQKMTIGKTSLSAKVKQGQATVTIPEAAFYGGSVSTQTVISALDQSVRKTFQIKNIQLLDFMKDATGDDRLSGTATLSGSVSGHGRSMQEMVASLQGSGAVKVTDGSIKGVNIADMVRNIQSAYKAVDRSEKKTDFAELSGTYTMSQGVIRNSDLAMKAPLMRLSGAGQVNLPLETIEYRLTPEFVETIQGQGGKEKQGVKVPVIVEGPLSDPSYRPDLQAAVQDVLKNPEAYKEKLGNVKEELKNLKGLFKR